jgi:hypothetical protein
MLHRRVFGLLLSALLGTSAWASAQVSTGSIAGVVRDASGAVLPGVIVEAASPALIEKVRSVVSDAQGNYKIIELRTGTYSVTFALPGFSTVKREGVEITAGFTAAVNAELKVGALEETVVVSGASPVVDVQNVRTQRVFSRDTMDALPTNKSVSAFANLTLGVTGMSSPTIDVGGNKGETFLAFSVHGGSTGDARSLLDGMDIAYGGTLARRNSVNQALIQEVALQTRGMSAETENGGVLINTIPKDGGNELKLYTVGSGTGPSLQGNNIGADSRAYGITEVAGIKHVYEFAAGLGGPIVKDKVWFYAANWWQGSGEYSPGVYFNATQHTSFFYTPDRSQRKYTTYDIRDHSGRVTWQATSKQKIAFLTSFQYSCLCFKLSGGVDANRSPEASLDQRGTPFVNQLTWQYPATNRLLLEAGTTFVRDASKQGLVGGAKAGDIAKEELATGFKWGARMEAVGAANDYGNTRYFRLPYRASLSYVTGSHASKAGAVGRLADSMVASGPERVGIVPYRLQVRNGVPAQITMFATPYLEKTNTHELGMFVQDQWTRNRLTINGGVRVDMLASSTPEVQGEAGLFRTAATYPADNPGWIGKDVSPRIGAAYDLFGDGKTAIKTSLGRYVAFTGAGGIAAGLAGANNNAQLITTSTTRNWTDTNGNLVPDCVLTNFAANGECGALANLTLGSNRPGTNFDFDNMRGWQQRGYNWQFNANLQHQLSDRIAAGFGYYRTWYGNFTATRNRALSLADYDQFCVTAPADPRLPTRGAQICGLYDVKPARFGLADNLVTKAKLFGELEQRYDGFDFSLNTRLVGGKLLAGGVSFGRTVVDNCALARNPEITAPGLTAATPRGDAFCRNEQPWSSTAQFKLQGVYPFPFWGLQMSGTLQNINTFAIAANRNFTNAEVRTSLGRDLGSCRGAATCNGTYNVSMVPDSTFYGPRLTQLDLRFTKSLKLGRARLVGNLDAYNVLNSGAPVQVNGTYGNGTTPGTGAAGTNAWQRPLTLIGPRLFKFGGQLDW